jgi:hypothetical protein
MEKTEEMKTEEVAKPTPDENMLKTSATFDKLNQIRNQRTGLARKYYNDLRCRH